MEIDGIVSSTRFTLGPSDIRSMGSGTVQWYCQLALAPIRLRESVIDSVEPLSDSRGLYHPCSSGDEGVRSAGLSRGIGPWEAPYGALQGDLHTQWFFGHPLVSPGHSAWSPIATCFGGGMPLFCWWDLLFTPRLSGAPVYRQLTDGLGGTHRPTGGIGYVAPRGDQVSHTCFRDEGWQASPHLL